MLLILLLLLLAACEPAEKKAEETKKSVPVTTALPVISDVPLYLETLGKLHPSIFMEIHSQIDGTVDQIFVSEGQEVFPQTPLLQIDARFFQIRRREAEAQSQMDQASLLALQKKKNRFQVLAEKDLLAKIEWDQLLAEIEKGEHALALAQAKLEAANFELSRCSLESPLQGRIGKIDLHPGSFISKGKPLFTLSQMDPLLLEFHVTEQELASLKEKNLEIEVLCGPHVCQQGTITFLNHQFDPATGLMTIRAKVPNPQLTSLPGQSVRVKIPIGTLERQILIPASAIRHNDAGPYVYVMQRDNTVALRQLLLGNEIDQNVIVLEGLGQDEAIITKGHLRLTPTSRVHVEEN